MDPSGARILDRKLHAIIQGMLMNSFLGAFMAKIAPPIRLPGKVWLACDLLCLVLLSTVGTATKNDDDI